MLSTFRPAVDSAEYHSPTYSEVPRRELLNTLLAHIGGLNKGRVTLATVFRWIYKGDRCIKTAVVSALGQEWETSHLSDEQKSRIESGANPRTFDLHLLLFLLEHLCGLDEYWNKPKDSLEFLINQVFLGPSINMDAKERLVEFENTLSLVLQKAGILSGTDPQIVEELVRQNGEYFRQMGAVLESESNTVPKGLISAINDAMDCWVTDGEEGDLVDHLLCLIEESGRDEQIIKSTVKRLKRSKRWILTGDMLDGFPLLLDSALPKHVTLIFQRNPLPSRVQETLEYLSRRDVEITFSSSNEGASYLKALTGPGSLCRITIYEGFLSAPTADHLPESVTSLSVSADFQSLPALAMALPRLKDLDFFSLQLLDNSRPNPEGLPSLPGPYMYIDSPRNLSTEDVPWWCHAARRICPPQSRGRFSYMDVSLSKGDDAELLVRQMHIQGVYAESLQIDCMTNAEINSDAVRTLAMSLGVSDSLGIHSAEASK